MCRGKDQGKIGTQVFHENLLENFNTFSGIQNLMSWAIRTLKICIFDMFLQHVFQYWVTLSIGFNLADLLHLKILQDVKFFYFEMFEGSVNMFKEDKSSMKEQIHETNVPNDKFWSSGVRGSWYYSQYS